MRDKDKEQKAGKTSKAEKQEEKEVCEKKEAEVEAEDVAEQAEQSAEADEKSEAEEDVKLKNNKKDKKDKNEAKIEELTDKLMRTMAEFDNFRRRSEKEKSQMFEIGAKDIIEKILPVLDNFERGLSTIREEEKGTAFAQGIEQIYKQFVTVLEDAGVKAIEAVGKEFNPDLHNAVMHAEDENLGENIISDEFQKGYTYRDTVVRHSMVKVVN
ncbi:nucleotide exchange factor GrpE [Anaeromicropila populeti]|uniref:Protein GrpE n=1 Tax=Anaeromicropila populeti TaxID=37658 RepID=A0A1I6IQ05_9FIRM|nr:nucleotide exchange factor GrpE [Anaeromicropila populeti]SFR68699.1 molecular chaperone GrpE [Anaeromicropila populeti]